MLPDFDRADRIGEFWGYPESRTFAELLTDCEEDQTLRAVPVGMLREAEREAERDADHAWSHRLWVSTPALDRLKGDSPCGSRLRPTANT
jgi:hypothetical protein